MASVILMPDELREVLRDLVCDMRADFRELIMQTMELARQDLIDRFNQEWKKDLSTVITDVWDSKLVSVMRDELRKLDDKTAT